MLNVFKTPKKSFLLKLQQNITQKQNVAMFFMRF